MRGGNKLKKEDLASYIDHTLLGFQVTAEKVKEAVNFAKDNQTASVCVSPDRLALVVDLLADSSVKACTVIGFPHGTQTTAAKVFEAEEAIKQGADELDMVINVGLLLDGEEEAVEEEIRQVVEAAQGKAVKVIIETAELTDDLIVKACQLSENAGAHFVKTSTGYGSGGATVETVALMKETVGDRLQVKASGGIRSYEDCLAMIEAGADRIGASRGQAILDQAPL